MSHRWFAILRVFAVSCLFVASASAQAQQQQTSLAERMAAMRRGWTGQEQSRQPAAMQQAPANQPQDESGSIWSNFLGRKPNKAPAPAATRPSTPNTWNTGLTHQTQAHQAQAHQARAQQAQAQQIAARNAAARNTAPQARPASQPTTNYSTAQNRNGGFTLPGLGGSPLPGSQASAAQNARPGAAQVAPHASRPTTGDYPVIVSNPLSHPNAGQQTQALPQAAANATTSARRSTPRQSPGQRPAPKVDPEALRRELAGSFPITATKSAPVARTAQVNETAGSATEDIVTDAVPASEPLATDNELKPDVVTPSVTATTEGPDSTGNMLTASQPVLEMKPTETIQSENQAINTTDNTPDYRAAFGEGFANQTPRNKDRAEAPAAAPPQAAFSTAALPESDSSNVLVSNETPVITTDILGPKQIVMGREATYRVQLHNQSDAAAEGIVASIRIPSSAEVVDTTTTQGMIQQARGATAPGQLEWQLSRLEPRASETLDIKLIPRASRPLELGVSWTLSPVGSRAVVQVQEPKLQMTVSGPDEVLFSEPQMFRLTLSNPGTGTAENVKIDLIPPGDGPSTVTSHTIGDLPPGAMKTVEVELTAREAGKLFVKASATAEGGLTSDASKEIFCRKPELDVDWRGPDTKYAGTVATYFVRVRNPGTAPADDVTVTVALPDGAEFASGSEGQLYDAKKRAVAWQVGTLSPGDDNYMELKCVVNSPGVNQLRIEATSSTSELTDEKIAETQVVALADLKLEVTDPSGPVAVGEQAVYEICVQNRGANTASDVNVVALFSEGIEPDQVEGAMYTVSDGRVTFRAIEQLEAGREIVLRIRAHAVEAGTHIFRAEVLCRELEIKLAAEETTRFYAEDAPSTGGGVANDATPSDGFQAASQ